MVQRDKPARSQDVPQVRPQPGSRGWSGTPDQLHPCLCAEFAMSPGAVVIHTELCIHYVLLPPELNESNSHLGQVWKPQAMTVDMKRHHPGGTLGGTQSSSDSLSHAPQKVTLCRTLYQTVAGLGTPEQTGPDQLSPGNVTSQPSRPVSSTPHQALLL